MKTANEYLTQAILWLGDNEKKSLLFSVALCWLLGVKIKEDTSEGMTAATDGVTLFLNPEWLSKASVQDRAFVFVHETEHAILRHAQQINTLLGGNIKSRTAKLANIAMDAWINYDVGRAFGEGSVYRPHSLGGGAFLDSSWPDGTPMFKDIHEFNPDDHDWYWLYQRIQIPADGNEQQEGDGFGNGSDLRDPSESDGDGQGSEEVRAQAEQAAARALAQGAARAAAQTHGNGGGWLSRLVGGNVAKLHDWRQELWQAAMSSVPQEYSFRKLNKSYSALGACVGTVSRPGLSAIVCAMDTSGSITEEMLAQPIAEVTAIVRDLKPEKVYQLWIDTEVAHVQVMEPGIPLSPEPKGGGGTDFKPAFDWVEENTAEGDVAMMIYFTDLYADYSQLVEPPYPVIWAVLPNSNPNPPPFGKVIRIGH